MKEPETDKRKKNHGLGGGQAHVKGAREFLITLKVPDAKVGVDRANGKGYQRHDW